jgi:predicted dehydrogenase
MMDKVSKLRFAVVGCGHIGKRHIKIIQEEPAAELVAICDTDKQVLSHLKLDHPGVQVYDDFHELLQRENLDIVSICTPHGLHSEMSIAVANAGVDILVEKPMALTTEASEQMIQTARDAGVKLYVVKQNRYNAPIMLTTEALAKKKLGKIFMVQCNVLWNRHQEYYDQSPWRGKRKTEGGALFTQVSHFLDLLIWWFGDVSEAQTVLETRNHDIEFEDCGASNLIFETGVMGSLTWTTCVYNSNYEGSITIIGEKGTIKIGGKYLNKIEFWDVQSYPMPDETEFDDLPNSYGSYQGSSSNHDKMVNDLVHQIIEGRKGVVEGEEGMRSIAAIEKIYQSANR